MPELIPAILVEDALEFQKRLAILKGHVKEAQIDIMDGRFVPNTTFADPGQIRGFQTSLRYELHLMVNDPGAEIEKWATPTLTHQGRGNVARAVIHAEIQKPLEPIIQKIKSYGWEAGIALNPETSWQQIDELISQLDTVLIMTVHPGKSGQPFGEVVASYHLLNKIFELHEAHPGLTISVDGGVNAETIPLLLEAGATRLVAGSAIFNQKDPLATLTRLKKLVSLPVEDLP